MCRFGKRLVSQVWHVPTGRNASAPFHSSALAQGVGITTPAFSLSVIFGTVVEEEGATSIFDAMSFGRIHCFLVATKAGDVIYERFYDRLSEAEKAEARAAFFQASNGARLEADGLDHAAAYR